jgi:hypothetical protein
MPLITYKPKRFTGAHEAVIAQANRIIEAYLAQDLTLTPRQLYYRFVAAALIPNTQRDYKRLGSIINDARLAGRIDWDAIEDRGRGLRGRQAWDDTADRIASAARSFHLDHWIDQECRVEVWVEKQALEAVIAQACRPLDVDYFACKGYMSQSEMWRAARRFDWYKANDQSVVMIHLGDHDPSGIDMTRDIDERTNYLFQSSANVIRIALNMPQVEEFGPPPNPAKLTDSRAGGYVAEHGYDSWELDALEPAYLRDLIQKEIWTHCDREKWDAIEELQEEQRELLEATSDRWDDVTRFLEEEEI